MEFFSKIALAFANGGGWMWVILVCHVASIAVIVERVISLYWRRKPVEKDFSNRFEAPIKKGQIQSVFLQAKEVQQSHPLARAIQAGAQVVMGFGGREEIQGKMDEVLLEENAKFEKKTSYLAMLANVSTLTGLPGTIHDEHIFNREIDGMSIPQNGFSKFP